MTHKNTDADADADSKPSIDISPHTEKSQALAVTPDDHQEKLNLLMAESVMSPEFSAALVVDAYRPEGKLDFLSIMAQLEAQHASLAADSLVQAANMLLGQAVALDAIFSQLAVRAVHAKSLDQTQCLLGLALRAQNGSRASLQTLGELKNPRHTTFVKQANIAQGQQQVNNGVAPARALPTHAQEEFPDSTNKLSGARHELLEDTRAAGPAITGYPVVAAVEKVHRAKDGRR